MNRNLYSLLGYMVLPFSLARLFFKSINNPHYRERISERLSLITNIPVPIIWVHCVSVGELRAATVLIDHIINNHPDYRVLVTTTTPTGSKAVTDYFQQRVLHFYFPFDLPIIINRYINKINPSICILLETEIWPNLIYTLNKKDIPIILANARLSARSLSKYQRLAKKLSKQALNQLTLIAAQNTNSAQRFVEMGANKEKILVAGNIKFDQAIESNISSTKDIKALINKPKVVVFASTHKGEESKILSSYIKYKESLKDTLLIIIPRHPERFSEVYKLVKKNKINIIKRSSNETNNEAEILIGDSMGEMMSYFEVCDIAFIGGSLNNTGGHNMLEPAALSKPIIFGPNVFNFSEISSSLVSKKGAIQVNNEDELFITINRLINDKEQMQLLGSNAHKFFNNKQGASKLIAERIKSLL